MNKAVGVSREEMTLPYYKFFEQPLAEIPAYKLEILKSGPSALPAVPFEQHNLFLAGEDKDFCQLGYGIMPDGTGFWSQYSYDKLICRKCQAITGSAYPFVPL